jgi:hypothetical protein
MNELMKEISEYFADPANTESFHISREDFLQILISQSAAHSECAQEVVSLDKEDIRNQECIERVLKRYL